MQLSMRGLAVASALVWGGVILFVGLINLASPEYGQGFLLLCASIYPGFRMDQTLLSVLIGTGYGLVDGAVLGLVFAWIYNRAAA